MVEESVVGCDNRHYVDQTTLNVARERGDINNLRNFVFWGVFSRQGSSSDSIRVVFGPQQILRRQCCLIFWCILFGRISYDLEEADVIG